MTRLLHIAGREASDRIWVDEFRRQVSRLGELTILENAESMDEAEIASHIRQCDILLTGWGSVMIPVEVASDPGSLAYVCNVTGTCRHCVPAEIVDAGIPVTNWGDAPAGRLAEGAVTLLMACLKSLPQRIDIVRDGGWKPGGGLLSGCLEGLNLGVYGCGMIGRRFVEMMRPFKPVMRVYDPYAEEIPDGCGHVDSLAELFASSEAVAIHAGLSDETRGSVSAELLASLPDGGIVINIARGGIVDQDALFAELESGRLRAGLDVLEPDTLEADHPARGWANLILTAHDIGCYNAGARRGGLDAMHHIALENIRRHLAGEPLRFVMDPIRYARST